MKQITIKFDKGDYRLKDGRLYQIETEYEDEYGPLSSAKFVLVESKFQIGYEGTVVSTENLRSGDISWGVNDNPDGVPGNSNPNICRYHGWRGTFNDSYSEAHGWRRVEAIHERKNHISVVFGRDLHPEWD